MMPFNIEELPMEHGAHKEAAVVITAKNPMVIGRDRIKHLKRPATLNDVDRWLIDQAARRSSRARVILFRAMNARNERVWEFDPSLSDGELEEGGYVLTKALLPFHRRLLVNGMSLMVHTDWGLRECYAMRYGVRRLAAEIKKGQSDADPVAEADRWVLGNMLLHVALSMDHVIAELLPSHLSMIERRQDRLKRLIARLPQEAID